MSKRTELELAIIGTLVSTFWVDGKAKKLKENCFSYALQRLKPHYFKKSEHREILKHLVQRANEGEDLSTAIEKLPEKLREYAQTVEDYEVFNFDRFRGMVEALVEIWTEEEKERIGIQLQAGEIDEQTAIKKLADLEKYRQNYHKKPAEIVVNLLNSLTDEPAKEYFCYIPGLNADIRFRPRQVSLIGARPGEGKTALAIAMSYKQMVNERAKVLFFSLELPAEELIQRYISYLTGIPVSRIKSKRLTDKELERVIEVSDEIANLPLEIYEDVNLTIPKFKAKVLEVRPDIIYIDYVQKFVQHRKYNSLREFLNEVSIELTNVAKQFSVPVIGLAQLNREAEKSKKKEDDMPKLSHLKETGQLEQDAAVVLVLAKQNKGHQLKIACVKNRDGILPPTSTVEFVNGFPVLDGDTIEKEPVSVPENLEFEF